MRKIEMYECEICKWTYKTEEEAISCEANGKEFAVLNEGDMVEFKHKVGGGFDPFYTPVKVGKIEDMGHYLEYSLLEEYRHEDGEVEWYERYTLYRNSDVEEYIKVS